MASKGKGLEASIWANSWGRSHDFRPAYESRARSVPPQQSTTTSSNATTNAPHAPIPTSGLAPVQAFQRFEQACQRLRWKYVDLQNSYNRAMSPEEAGFTPADAERNFKVDFHEFYAWIEQALVLVLHVFGVVVPRGIGRGNIGVVPNGSTAASHTFHHNVLSALDDEEAGPLREGLGAGETKQALWKAKELRNRWKDAAEGKETPPLKMYDLRWIVGTILVGLEEAYGLAARRVEEEIAKGESGGRAMDGQGEDSWEWMVDSMDWEA